MADLAHHPSMVRRYYDMKVGRQQFVSLKVVDEMFTVLGLQHVLQIPKENGGLRDIYVDGVQYGAPDRSPKKPVDTTVRYATEEERRAAKRRSWRESKQRAAARKAL
jgi:hypothetical protein